MFHQCYIYFHLYFIIFPYIPRCVQKTKQIKSIDFHIFPAFSPYFPTFSQHFPALLSLPGGLALGPPAVAPGSAPRVRLTELRQGAEGAEGLDLAVEPAIDARGR